MRWGEWAELCWVLSFYALGAQCFFRGFLLSRQSLLQTSSCGDFTLPGALEESSCWVPARFSRAVLVVIDALRYDFVAPPNSTQRAFSSQYHGRLPTLGRLLREEAESSLLLRFRADAPTTTMQRLKGLTTGSLPTFIDASANFASAAVEEDSLIEQLRRLNRTLVQLGDDTWTDLFPSHFTRNFSFPSFDVKDLHTVDDGVLAHLHQELARPDWSLLVAHFLGVDHCGHAFGPEHPAMAAKLEQMDGVLARVVKEALDEDTLLVVAGDHGMTRTGDHGGDSEDETEAALFLYAKGQRLHSAVDNVGEEVNQIDLVPTLALLLDFPIPFSSLGSLIPQLFGASEGAVPRDRLGLERASRAVLWQVARYAEHYQAHLSEGLEKERLKVLLRGLHSHLDSELTPARSAQIVADLHRVFHDSWAKFNWSRMYVGLLVLLENLLFSGILLLRLLPVKRPHKCLSKPLLGLKGLGWLLMLLPEREELLLVNPLVGILVLLQLPLCVHSLGAQLRVLRPLPSLSELLPSLFPPGLLLVSGLGLFSNSYVVWEASMLRFLCASLFTFYFLRSLRPLSEKLRRERQKLGLRRFLDETCGGWGKAAQWLGALALLRLGEAFERCREEQGPDCADSPFSLPFASLQSGHPWKAGRYVLGLAALALLSLAFRRELKKSGNLSGYAAPVAVLRLSTALVSGLVALYWTSLWLPPQVLERHRAWVQLGLPLSVYGLVLLGLTTLIASPLLVNFVGKDEVIGGPQAQFPGAEVGPAEYARHFKANAAKYLGPDFVLAVGLDSAVGGGAAAVAWLLCLLFALLLGEGLAVPLVCLVGLLWRSSVELPASAALSVVPLLGGWAFYSLGHQPVFSAIPWDAAFLGLPGNFRLWGLNVQAVPVFLNVFAGHLLAAAAAPFLGSSSGEPSALLAALLCGWGLGLRALLASAAAFLHARHLMVWKIFAPRWVFEALGLLGSLAALALSAALRVRLANAAAHWSAGAKRL